MNSLPEGLDLSLMNVLHLLLETQSVTQTAERLGVSQPTVSRSLARLRRHLSDPLLVRSRGGMVLTPRAERMKDPLKAWLAEGRSFLTPDCFDPARAAREFRIASTDFGVLRVIRPVLARITEEAPHCTITIELLNASSFRSLASADLDLVVTGFDPSGGLFARKLFVETLSCVVRRGHPLLQADNPTALATLGEWPQILMSIGEVEVDWIGKALRSLGIHPRHALRIDSFTLTPYLIEESDAIAVLPGSAARHFARIHDVVELPLPIEVGSFQYWLAWHERSRKDAGVAWLLDLLAAPFVGKARR